eukprot:g7959.t1
MSNLSVKPEDWLTKEQLEYLKDHVVMTDAQLSQLRSQIHSLTDINIRLRAFKKTVIEPIKIQRLSQDPLGVEASEEKTP